MQMVTPNALQTIHGNSEISKELVPPVKDILWQENATYPTFNNNYSDAPSPRARGILSTQHEQEPEDETSSI